MAIQSIMTRHWLRQYRCVQTWNITTLRSTNSFSLFLLCRRQRPWIRTWQSRRLKFNSKRSRFYKLCLIKNQNEEKLHDRVNPHSFTHTHTKQTNTHTSMSSTFYTTQTHTHKHTHLHSTSRELSITSCSDCIHKIYLYVYYFLYLLQNCCLYYKNKKLKRERANYR